MDEARFPPQGSCDCHVHVVGPKRQFPLIAHRSYTPMDAPLPALQGHLARLGLARVVLVQRSFYGTDNSCMLAALASLGPSARGVAVVGADVSAAELDRLHHAGVRGLRLNVATLKGTTDAAVAAALRATARLCSRNGWHIQVFLPASSIKALTGVMRTLDVAVVIDHFGLVTADPEDPALPHLLDLMAFGHVWVKLSAPYRVAATFDDPRLEALAGRLYEAAPARVVWGSDWPHTPVHTGTPVNDDHEAPYRNIDTARLLALAARWFAKPERQRAVMTENPARLYGF